MFYRPIAPGIDLRLLEPRHAGELFAVVDANRERLRPWFPWVDASRAPGDVETWVREMLGQFAGGLGFSAGVFADGRLAGVVGFNHAEPAHRRAAIGYWLAGEFEGRGLMSAAVRAMCDYAFEDWGMHRLEIGAAAENVRSRALARRVGFVEEGLLREADWVGGEVQDIVLHGMLARDWREARG